MAREGTVGEVIDERVKVYGDPVVTFVQIAQVWSGILGVEVQATDVPLCLIGMKLVRTTQAPDYSDNSDDVEGYLDIFRQIVGPDMVHARSVAEYIEKKCGSSIIEPTKEQLDFAARYANELEDRGIANGTLLDALQAASYKARQQR